MPQVWLKSKYIKTKQNHKLKANFQPIQNSTSGRKVKPINWNHWRNREFTTFSTCHYWNRTPQRRGRWTNLSQKYKKAIAKNKEYEVKAYGKELNSNHLPSLYYLISWKDYREKENIWKYTLTILHLQKIISIFYHDHPENLTITFLLIDSTSPMARSTVKPRAKVSSTKQKWDRPPKANNTIKNAKKNWTSIFI